MKIVQNLSPTARKGLYAATGASLFALVVFKVVSPDSVPQILQAAGYILGIGAAAVALPNVPKD